MRTAMQGFITPASRKNSCLNFTDGAFFYVFSTIFSYSLLFWSPDIAHLIGVLLAWINKQMNKEIQTIGSYKGHWSVGSESVLCLLCAVTQNVMAFTNCRVIPTVNLNFAAESVSVCCLTSKLQRNLGVVIQYSWRDQINPQTVRKISPHCHSPQNNSSVEILEFSCSSWHANRQLEIDNNAYRPDRINWEDANCHSYLSSDLMVRLMEATYSSIWKLYKTG